MTAATSAGMTARAADTGGADAPVLVVDLDGTLTPSD